jgi:hypothetical protein
MVVYSDPSWCTYNMLDHQTDARYRVYIVATMVANMLIGYSYVPDI